MKMPQIKTRITEVGQTFVDAPLVYVPKQAPAELAVSAAFHDGQARPKKIIHYGFERIRLRWRKPGDGL